ncbi:hypothetical protein KFL_007930040 [Klebsormidium nitens]|uniref:Uncharacterized protein n=1 Tax=Klebsormidium nitens TaxID=105231 RepID=A0A1Y1IQF6_KLENI|nr:hypothetical protein KFL_007930040 [Klebsormidium nitens]|eukprot:GAQ91481.1 hypothetical protein KFL_007930040 [Klebsormidium nitens]
MHSGDLAGQSNQRCWALERVALAHTKAGAGPAAEIASDPDKRPLEEYQLPKRQALDMRTVPSTKVCTVCEIELPAADFAWRTASPDGLEFRCRACYAVQSYAARGRIFPGLRVSEKRCVKCGQVRPGTFFAAARATSDGLQPRCRTCAAKNSARRLARLAGERAESARFEAPPATTICSKCAQELPTEVFHRDIYSSTGRAPTCPACNYVRVTERRKAVGRPSEPLVAEKRCSACRDVKPADEFYFHAYSTDGLTYQCRECWQAQKRRNKERTLASQGAEGTDNEPGAGGALEGTSQSM